MKLGLQRRLGYGGQKHPWRQRPNTWLARVLARRSRGGLIFLEDQELLDQVGSLLGLRAHKPLSFYIEELLGDQALTRAFERARQRGLSVEDASWPARVARLRGIATVYYALLRELRPKVVLETGTAAGGYTAFALAALHRNGEGRLISIDIPPVAGRLTMDVSVPAENVGYLLPEEHRDRWQLHQGDAKVLLPRVLLEERVDVFIHDSLHTRTHMLFEYAVARALMDEGKLIISDDIMWNDAFQNFLVSHQLYGFAPYSHPDTGLCINAFDDFERGAGLGVWKNE